jgi:hypothetical protein
VILKIHVFIKQLCRAAEREYTHPPPRLYLALGHELGCGFEAVGIRVNLLSFLLIPTLTFWNLSLGGTRNQCL